MQGFSERLGRHTLEEFIWHPLQRASLNKASFATKEEAPSGQHVSYSNWACVFGWLVTKQDVPVSTTQAWVHGNISILVKCSWMTETTAWGQLGTAPGWVLGLGKGTCAFKLSCSLLGESLALGTSPCCLGTGPHCAKSSGPWGVALLAQACSLFLPRERPS